ncbi:lipase family protein [Gordonia sp. OPL2]|uniref:lipase family protein n=1 Tax=Gordonia sp. OPL2 TaxID=2486274 RepID=UPI0021CD020E|nr:lipase family protein [Gordonia sp. OPL2]
MTSASDPFYASGHGVAAVANAQPGDVLRTRTVSYRITGVPTAVTAVQIVYRTTDVKGRPTSNVTSVLKPTGPARAGAAVSYQSFYDSLDPEHSPSRSVAGSVSFGGLINNMESVFLIPLLARGYPVIVTDTEGQRANFAAGPEYAYNTIDAIRAAGRVSSTGLSDTTRVALYGYSGGAIATNWAAALAPRYAPDVNRRLVGATSGGLLVAPASNLTYVDGSLGWSGVAVMAIAGLGRSYDIDFRPYLSERGRQLVGSIQRASIADVLFRYPGLRWSDLVLPKYADPRSVQPFVDVANRINLGSQPTPTIPLQVAQALNGWLEGTAGNKPSIDSGDGVMIAGDVRSLLRQYCASGNRSVQYIEYPVLSHSIAALPAEAEAIKFIEDRFAGRKPLSTCGNIAPGNSLAPLVGTGK